MKDVQFLSELLLVVLKCEVSGFDQDEIDEFYAQYDDIEESQIEIDLDKIAEDFIAARRYLISIEKYNAAISTYAGDFKNFYTLWSLIVLNPTLLPNPHVFADKYSAFMADVMHLKDPTQFELITSGQVNTIYKSSLKYYQAGLGASTEEPQRRARLEAILELVRHDEGI